MTHRLERRLGALENTGEHATLGELLDHLTDAILLRADPSPELVAALAAMED